MGVEEDAVLQNIYGVEIPLKWLWECTDEWLL